MTTLPSQPGYACPSCRGALAAASDEWLCDACGWKGSTVAGVPILLRDSTQAEHDELDHHHQRSHKAAQVAHFDRADEEAFETNRPHGSSRLYRSLLGEKFRRAANPVRAYLAGSSALTVCGGSGMDAEYLSRTGAIVITSDLSLGAATRAKIRAELYGLQIQSIVADVEHLPFTDQSVDVVAVHDGLHHLDDPYAGLSEMARVARRWVIVTEPARAALTQLAVRMGLALDREDAGNRVARMDPAEVRRYLEARGFVIVRAERYAMYYPHHPGAVFRFLSQPLVYPFVRAATRAADLLLGRIGNKMVVVAERAQSVATETDSALTPSPAGSRRSARESSGSTPSPTRSTT